MSTVKETCQNIAALISPMLVAIFAWLRHKRTSSFLILLTKLRLVQLFLQLWIRVWYWEFMSRWKMMVNEKYLNETPNEVKESFFLSHSIFEKYFVQCFGIRVPQRKRTEGMQEMQQYDPAMWWPPLYNLHHPLLSTTSTDYCCTVQLKSFMQHKAKAQTTC